MHWKIKHKKIVVAGGIVLLLAAGAAGVYVVTQNQSTEEKVPLNQRIAYAYLTGIEGNEVTYMEVEESVVTAALETSSDTGSDTAKGNSAAKGDKTQTDENGTNSNADSSDAAAGDMPSGDAPSGDMPSDTSGTDGSAEAGSGAAQESTGKRNGRMDMASSTIVTSYIPVGVTVHTTSDASTTFSRLATGDLLKLLLETDASGNEVIVEVWMLQ